jgi:hypothetical protein
MSHPSSAENLEGIVDELIALYLAQAADLREYAQAAAEGEGTVHLERTLRHREVQRADLYRRFEKAVLPASAVPDLADAT